MMGKQALFDMEQIHQFADVFRLFHQGLKHGQAGGIGQNLQFISAGS